MNELKQNALLNSMHRSLRVALQHNLTHKYLDLNIKSVGITTNPL
ncbi:hypothetical protein [Leptospira noguchii]|nr:hypothetical protein [Leptospira noguchii]